MRALENGYERNSAFNLDINEIIEEAYERAGLGRAFSVMISEPSITNLLSQDLPIEALTFDNRRVNLVLSTGTATYDLPADTAVFWTIPSGRGQAHLKVT